MIVDIYETNVHLKLFYLSFLLRGDKIWLVFKSSVRNYLLLEFSLFRMFNTVGWLVGWFCMNGNIVKVKRITEFRGLWKFRSAIIFVFKLFSAWMDASKVTLNLVWSKLSINWITTNKPLSFVGWYLLFAKKSLSQKNSRNVPNFKRDAIQHTHIASHHVMIHIH